VFGRHRNDQFILVEQVPGKARKLLDLLDDGQFYIPPHQPLAQLLRAATLEAYPDLGMQPFEIGQIARQHIHRHGHCGAQLHPASLEALAGLGRLHKLLQGLNRPSGLGQQILAGLAQHQAASLAVEQGLSNKGFQRPQVLADPWLGHAQAEGGPSHTALLHNAQEHPQGLGVRKRAAPKHKYSLSKRTKKNPR